MNNHLFNQVKRSVPPNTFCCMWQKSRTNNTVSVHVSFMESRHAAYLNMLSMRSKTIRWLQQSNMVILKPQQFSILIPEMSLFTFSVIESPVLGKRGWRRRSRLYSIQQIPFLLRLSCLFLSPCLTTAPWTSRRRRSLTSLRKWWWAYVVKNLHVFTADEIFIVVLRYCHILLLPWHKFTDMFLCLQPESWFYNKY